ncbi:tyrosine-type DNA invertase [Hafnia alvei]|uniref:Type 1 fimbriae regulatory protein FimB n=1 Tax=Hafnia alvei TaxID=569 RepID=A0A1C6Z6M5_HAFAL|nr:tyrosine-type DNA invertase [Hafnia alvei]NLS54160.1 tyrosine-type recombinase/integrase [Hafnia alvei]SCM54728.1 type 1 fimbriae regulatory protein FimB [Hafnia alvei]
MNSRKYLSESEIERILFKTKDGRYPLRDYCIINTCFMHGLRVTELCNLQLSDIDIDAGEMHIRRLKNGFSTTHPVYENEACNLELWIKERKRWLNSEGKPWLFLSQKGSQLSRQHIYTLLKNYASMANIGVSAHPHMLRHACGYALANQGTDTRLIQDYLGHRNIHHTVIYTASNSMRFQRLWRK